MKTLLLLALLALPWPAWGQKRFDTTSRNGIFYFIDENGKPIKKLGQWETAEKFNHRHFTEVRKGQNAYLLDTLGNTYLLAKTLAGLGAKTHALVLERLDTFPQKAIDTFPKIINNHTHLKILLIEGRFASIPSEIQQLKDLEYLGLKGCSRLTSPPAEIMYLKKLKQLDLSLCHSLTRLPAEIGLLKKLKMLDLSAGKHRNTLPAEIGGLRNLEHLDLSRCRNLASLPIEIGQLKSIKDLILAWCSSLAFLPTEIGDLKNLEYLDLSWCKSLLSLPTEIGQLKNLKELSLFYCSNLASLPAEIGGLKNLEYLDLSYTNLTFIPEHFKKLKKLKQITLRNTPMSQTEAQRKDTEAKIKAVLPKCGVVW